MLCFFPSYTTYDLIDQHSKCVHENFKNLTYKVQSSTWIMQEWSNQVKQQTTLLNGATNHYCRLYANWGLFMSAGVLNLDSHSVVLQRCTVRCWLPNFHENILSNVNIIVRWPQCSYNFGVRVNTNTCTFIAITLASISGKDMNCS